MEEIKGVERLLAQKRRQLEAPQAQETHRQRAHSQLHLLRAGLLVVVERVMAAATRRVERLLAQDECQEATLDGLEAELLEEQAKWAEAEGAATSLSARAAGLRGLAELEGRVEAFQRDAGKEEVRRLMRFNEARLQTAMLRELGIPEEEKA